MDRVQKVIMAIAIIVLDAYDSSVSRLELPIEPLNKVSLHAEVIRNLLPPASVPGYTRVACFVLLGAVIHSSGAIFLKLHKMSPFTVAHVDLLFLLIRRPFSQLSSLNLGNASQDALPTFATDTAPNGLFIGKVTAADVTVLRRIQLPFSHIPISRLVNALFVPPAPRGHSLHSACPSPYLLLCLSSLIGS
jgi:hypothetical protein